MSSNNQFSPSFRASSRQKTWSPRIKFWTRFFKQTSTNYPRRQWWTTRNGRGCLTTPPGPMNCLSWNCCGLGQLVAVHELIELVKKHSPTILFLMETRAKDHKLKTLCSKLHLENVFLEPRVNRGGRLALYLKDGINFKVLDSTPTFIEAVVNLGMDDA